MADTGTNILIWFCFKVIVEKNSFILETEVAGTGVFQYVYCCACTLLALIKIHYWKNRGTRSSCCT